MEEALPWKQCPQACHSLPKDCRNREGKKIGPNLDQVKEYMPAKEILKDSNESLQDLNTATPHE